MGGAEFGAGVLAPVLAAQPFAVQEVGAGGAGRMRVRLEPLDRLAVELSAASPSLSRARERASTPSAQSVPLARVVSDSRSSGVGCEPGLVPLRTAASISSASDQHEDARSSSYSQARSAAARALS